MKLLKVIPSDRKEKKLMAIFCMCKGESCCDTKKKVHFGASGMDDYTKTKDKEQRERYRARHATGRTAKPDTPNALAYWLLWGDSTNLQTNIKNFKIKYNL